MSEDVAAVELDDRDGRRQGRLRAVRDQGLNSERIRRGRLVARPCAGHRTVILDTNQQRPAVAVSQANYGLDQVSIVESAALSSPLNSTS